MRLNSLYDLPDGYSKQIETRSFMILDIDQSFITMYIDAIYDDRQVSIVIRYQMK
jgi:hypothetical protein